MSKEELLKGLSEEQIAKAKECKSQEELLNLAKEEGIELTDDQLEAVAGGGCGKDEDVMECPDCHSKDHVKKLRVSGSSGTTYKCSKCNITWTVW